MKLKSNFILIGSVVILAASPAAFARGGKGHPHKAPKAHAKAACMAFEATGDDTVVSETGDSGTTNGGAEVTGGEVTVVVDGTTGEPPVDGGAGTVTEVVDGGVILDKDPTGEGLIVPTDWIKRGDHPLENPDVIFYNMAGGGLTPTALGASKGNNVVRGQADKGAAIEAKSGAAVPQINRENKGPEALVKKGHVFLR